MRAITPLPPDLCGRLVQELARLGFRPQQGQVLGLAVSGGSDSLALLHLAHEAGLNLRVATVDHGLRPESRAEAQLVAARARALGLTHQILPWQGWDGRGNVQDQARRARRDLLAGWARAQGLAGVAMAHTRDDLAETLLMRLARGAGVDGLAAMAGRFAHAGALFLRPLLWAGRGELRAELAQRGLDWIDDPSNDMPRYDRARLRRALPDLAKLGLTPAALAQVAQNMAQAREALDAATQTLARAHITQRAGILSLAPGWQAAPPETQRRLIAHIIGWIAPADYAPRGPALLRALNRLQAGQPLQLAGCHFLPHRGQIIACREAARCAPPQPLGQIWDGIWQAAPSDTQAPNSGLLIRALGPDGLRQWPAWRETGLPRAALLSQPSLWQGQALLATPLRPASPAATVFFRQARPEHPFDAIIGLKGGD